MIGPSPYHIYSNGNAIQIYGELNVQRYRTVLAAMHNLVTKLGYKDITLDFTNCEFSHAPAMLPIVSCVQRYRQYHIDFSIGMPTSNSLRRLFLNSNWAHYLDPNTFPMSDYDGKAHLPAITFRSPQEQNSIVNRVMDTLLKNIPDFERTHFKAIEWSLGEITDNVLVHSESDSGGIIQVTARKAKSMVEFVVADSGIGAADSLRRSHKAFTSDVDALDQAIREGITRDKSVGQGNGLFGTYQVAVESDGLFNLSSNYATLDYTEKVGLHTKKEDIPYHGTTVVCGINYSKPLVLEKALNFRGKPHVPIDQIDIKHEIDLDGQVVFELSKESNSYRSRVAGTPVRQYLINLSRLSETKRIVIDFSDIHLISSSFADEVFGKMFLEMGAMLFTSTFTFRNVEETTKRIIDKAIAQRISASFRGSDS